MIIPIDEKFSKGLNEGISEGVSEGLKDKLVVLVKAIANDEGKRIPQYAKQVKDADKILRDT